MGGVDSVLDMARTLAADGNTSDAEALVRFALSTDPESSRAHIELARMRAARGEEGIALDALIETVRARASKGVDDPTPLYAMLTAALEIDASRLELHVDLAELQAAHGDLAGARARLIQLSAVYMDAGREEDAGVVLEVASSWDPQGSMAGIIGTALPVEESIEILLEEVGEDSASQPAPAPVRVARAHTICTPTLLRDASGRIIPEQDAIPAPATGPRRVRRATICTPTLLRDAQGRLLPNQLQIPKPATGHGRASRIPKQIPAPPTGASKRPSAGQSPSTSLSRTSIRTLQARVRVRKEPEVNRDLPLARRLRDLGGLSE